MFPVLYFIALFLTVGAQNPLPATDYDKYIDALDKMREAVLKNQESWIQRVKTDHSLVEKYSEEFPQSDKTSNISAPPVSATHVSSETLAWVLDKFSKELVQGIDNMRETWRKQPSPLPHGYPESPLRSAESSTTEKRSQESVTTEKQEVYSPSRIGSIRGIPGVHFPRYTDFPVTSFSCSSKAYIPGFYADLETGCQVFHVCWPDRRESFLCPIGTTFNQAILACDLWYRSDCSLASYYYNVNAQSRLGTYGKGSKTVSMIDYLLRKVKSAFSAKLKGRDLSYILRFLPVKAKVFVYPDAKISAEASIGKGKTAIKKETTKTSIKTFDHFIKSLKTIFSPFSLKSAKDKSVYAHRGLKAAVILVQEVISFMETFLQGIARSAYVSKSGLKLPQFREEESTRNFPPLTNLNPRFITKPIQMPESDVEDKISDARPSKLLRAHFTTSKSDDPAQVVMESSSKMIHTSSSSQELRVSETTKNVIIHNSLKLFHLRRE